MSTTQLEAPQFPAGAFTAPAAFDPAAIRPQADALAATPSIMRTAIRGLTPAQLDTKYRNWTVRQIVHHMADASTNVYIRWKLALTEDNPRITPYDEGLWAELAEPRTTDPAVSLSILDGIHARLDAVIRAMKPADFERSFYHPQYDKSIKLWHALAMYSHHAKHHAGQIDWLRQQKKW
jgi:hypothetical protein